MFVCVCVCGGGGGCLCMCVCVCVLRMVSKVKILCFVNTFCKYLNYYYLGSQGLGGQPWTQVGCCSYDWGSRHVHVCFLVWLCKFFLLMTNIVCLFWNASIYSHWSNVNWYAWKYPPAPNMLCHPLLCCVTHCCVVTHCFVVSISHCCIVSPTAVLCHPLLWCVTHCCVLSPMAVMCHPLLCCITRCCVVSPSAVLSHTAVLCHPLPCCHLLLYCITHCCVVTHCYVVSPIAVLSPTAVLLHPLQCCVTHCYVVTVPLLCCRICWRKERPCHVPSARSLCRKRMAVIGYDAPSARRRFAGSPRDRGGGLR